MGLSSIEDVRLPDAQSLAQQLPQPPQVLPPPALLQSRFKVQMRFKFKVQKQNCQREGGPDTQRLRLRSVGRTHVVHCRSAWSRSSHDQVRPSGLHLSGDLQSSVSGRHDRRRQRSGEDIGPPRVQQQLLQRRAACHKAAMRTKALKIYNEGSAWEQNTDAVPFQAAVPRVVHCKAAGVQDELSAWVAVV